MPTSRLIPLSQPHVGRKEELALRQVLKSGWLTTGPRVQRFENEFCQFVNSRHAIALNSGTAALHLSLLAAGIGPGDHVITSPLTFAATANVIELVGARTIFSDVNPQTWNLDPPGAASKVTRSTKAILAVDYTGLPCDLIRLRAIARRRGILLIEDAAHSVGAAVGRHRVGHLADLTCFSFHPMKNITAGEGGMVTTSSARWMRSIRLLRFHGLSIETWKRQQQTVPRHPEILLPGYKYAMSDLQAAMGLVQLEKLEWLNAQRRRWAELYHTLLADVDELILPPLNLPGVERVWHLYVVVLRDKRRRNRRDDLLQELRSKGIQAGVHYPCLHLHPYYRKRYGYAWGDLPVAESVGTYCLSLPLYPHMKRHQVLRVSQALRESLKHS